MKSDRRPNEEKESKGKSRSNNVCGTTKERDSKQ